MLRTLIIDDEAHIRNTLSLMLKRFCPQVAMAGEADGVKSGIEAIETSHPELVFLDINLSDGSGFDLLHKLKTIDFSVVFISSFNNRSIKAFRLSGLKYLQKPFSPVELLKSVNESKQIDAKDFRLHLEVLEYDLAFEN